MRMGIARVSSLLHVQAAAAELEKGQRFWAEMSGSCGAPSLLSSRPEAVHHLEALSRIFFVASILHSCSKADNAAAADVDSQLEDSCQQCIRCWQETLQGAAFKPL